MTAKQLKDSAPRLVPLAGGRSVRTVLHSKPGQFEKARTVRSSKNEDSAFHAGGADGGESREILLLLVGDCWKAAFLGRSERAEPEFTPR
jgi:hypothetical protein